MKSSVARLFSDLSFQPSPMIQEALDKWSTGSVEERGAIFTRREVVDFILDLVEYNSDCELHERRLLEPCFGHGDFLFPAIERLLAAYFSKERSRSDFESLTRAIRAVELHHAAFETTKQKLNSLPSLSRFVPSDRERLLAAWIVNGDFLLQDGFSQFDFVVGNPPYVRQELIPDVLLTEYRRRYATIYDRADIYVPFIERSLCLLATNGVLGFICADRWMKNRYGGPLRRLVADNFHLKFHVDMVATQAFHSDVIAYPAITIISRQRAGATRLAYRPKIDKVELARLARAMTQPAVSCQSIREIDCIAKGDEPWIVENSERLAIVRRLESIFPTLEAAGCKIGIGVATGADRVFIGSADKLDIEENRRLPLVMTRDIQKGEIQWRGNFVLNPFEDDGRLVCLDDYPKLKHYLNTHGSAIKARHVARRNPAGWYRTIDKIIPALTHSPKLLIPDIKGGAHIVYDSGSFYPHHNLYFITSTEWDLVALRALLMSGIARLFVSTYSTKMHGGFLRFQAQYLRRIRLPRWTDVSSALRTKLMDAARRSDTETCNELVMEAYGLEAGERALLNFEECDGYASRSS